MSFPKVEVAFLLAGLAVVALALVFAETQVDRQQEKFHASDAGIIEVQNRTMPVNPIYKFSCLDWNGTESNETHPLIIECECAGSGCRSLCLTCVNETSGGSLK